MNESETKQYKSPRRKLVKFFEKSRDQWKAKSIAAKALVKYYWNQNRTDEGWSRELEGIKEITRTKDCHEGIRAFLDKRDPEFRGPYYDNSPFRGGDGD